MIRASLVMVQVMKNASHAHQNLHCGMAHAFLNAQMISSMTKKPMNVALVPIVVSLVMDQLRITAPVALVRSPSKVANVNKTVQKGRF